MNNCHWNMASENQRKKNKTKNRVKNFKKEIVLNDNTIAIELSGIKKGIRFI